MAKTLLIKHKYPLNNSELKDVFLKHFKEVWFQRLVKSKAILLGFIASVSVNLCNSEIEHSHLKVHKPTLLSFPFFLLTMTEHSSFSDPLSPFTLFVFSSHMMMTQVLSVFRAVPFVCRLTHCCNSFETTALQLEL